MSNTIFATATSEKEQKKVMLPLSWRVAAGLLRNKKSALQKHIQKVRAEFSRT